MDSDKLLVVCTNSAGDRKLYGILRNAEGQVWDWKHEKFVDFIDGNYFTYVIAYQYKGGDIYALDVPKLEMGDIACIIVYIQGGRKPDIYDKIYHVYGAEMPKEIPEKIRPMAPAIRDPKLRPRSKVKVDAYSKD